VLSQLVPFMLLSPSKASQFVPFIWISLSKASQFVHFIWLYLSKASQLVSFIRLFPSKNDPNIRSDRVWRLFKKLNCNRCTPNQLVCIHVASEFVDLKTPSQICRNQHIYRRRRLYLCITSGVIDNLRT
jgi:hypothetical protein